MGFTLSAHSKGKDAKVASPSKQLFQTTIGKGNEIDKCQFEQRSAN